jgi:hypothetical protein
MESTGMSDAEINLYDLFGWGKVQLSKTQLSNVDMDKAYKEMGETISKEAGQLKVVASREWLLGELGHLLKRVHLINLLAGAWNKSRQLNKYLDAGKYPPGDPVYVELLEHTITSTQRPSLELIVGGQVRAEVPFEIDLKLTLQGVVLKIDGGRIREIRSASVKGKGNIKIGGAELFEKEIGPLFLPGVVDLGEGRQIEPAAAPARLP